MQYDFGKTVRGANFEHASGLNKPPQILLTAISKLQATHMLKPNQIPDLLSEAVARYPMVRDKFTYRGQEQHRLFDHICDHDESKSTCDHCDQTKLVAPSGREGT